MTRAPLAGADLSDWIALRRVNSGGIARTGDCWVDGGRPVPTYVADALAALCEAGLVELADPNTGGMARAVLTDAGTDRFEQLVQQRQQALTAQLSTASRGRAAAAQIGFLVAVCRLMAQSMPASAQRTERRCPTCKAGPAPQPQGHTPPDSGRPPVEQPPRQIPAPGSQPDTSE